MRVKSFFWVALALFCTGVLISSALNSMAPHRATHGAAHAAPGSQFVTNYGGQLYLNGRPYIFHGLNIFNVININNCWYPLGVGSSLDANLNAIGSGQNALRGWFFQYEATINGQRDWSGIDHVLAVAQAHGQHVIAVLANQWDDCEKPPQQTGYKPESWYQSGYRTTIDPGTVQTYRDWVASIVARYRNNPTILAWQLMNESEDRLWRNGPCSRTAFQTLYNWASDMSGLVKSIDPNHLVSLGTIGGGQCPLYSDNYTKIHALRNIDLCEYHDYNPANDVLPGDQWNGLVARINACKKMGKPLFVGENGISGQEVQGNLRLRAVDYAAKFVAQFGAGVVGELVWDWRAQSWGGSSTTGYEVGPGDPTLGVLAPNNGHGPPIYAQVISAAPAIGSTIKQAPATVTVFCSQNINPASGLSNLFINGPSGQLLSQGNAIVSPSNPKQMSISLKSGGNGVYTVRWATVSAVDGSFDQGSFVFTINSAATPTPGSTATPTTPATDHPNSSATPTIIQSGAESVSGTTSGGSGAIPRWVPIIGGAPISADAPLWEPLLIGMLTLLVLLLALLAISKRRHRHRARPPVSIPHLPVTTQRQEKKEEVLTRR